MGMFVTFPSTARERMEGPFFLSSLLGSLEEEIEDASSRRNLKLSGVHSSLSRNPNILLSYSLSILLSFSTFLCLPHLV